MKITDFVDCKIALPEERYFHIEGTQAVLKLMLDDNVEVLEASLQDSGCYFQKGWRNIVVYLDLGDLSEEQATEILTKEGFEKVDTSVKDFAGNPGGPVPLEFPM
jgi:hypothetical protein